MTNAPEDPDTEAERLRKENEKLRRDIEKLKKEVEKLRDELTKLRGSLPVLAASEATAEAAGVPSSKIFYRRSTPPGEKKPTGGQVGHPGHARTRPEPNAPPLLITLEECPECGNRLGEPCDILKRTITDIPEPAVHVYEIHTARYACSTCKTRVTGTAPIPPNEQFGPSLKAWVVYHRMLALSVLKVQQSLRETFGLSLSEATIIEIEKGGAEALGPLYEDLKKLVNEADVVNADETRFPVGGRKGWLWVFSSLLAVVYRVAPTRASTVPVEMLPEFEGTLVRDAYDPYDKVKDAQQQLDLLHVNRWLERAEVKHGIEPRKLVRVTPPKFTRPGRPPKNLLTFVEGARTILREAILFVFPKDAPASLTAEQRTNAYNRFRARMLEHLDLPWTDEDAVRISKELRARLDQLFTFVRLPNVPWHNNDAERAIRSGVLHRKISGGRRTWEGAQRFETLLSVFETCKKTGKSFLKKLRELLTEWEIPESSDHRGTPQT